MSISILRQANSKNFSATPIYPHANTGFEAITFGSDQYESYIDFVYSIRLTDYKTGNDFRNLIPPLNSSGYSYFDAIKPINQSVHFTAQPEITAFSANTSHMGKYKFTVTEYYSGKTYDSSSVYGIYANTSLKQFLNDDIYEVNMLDYSINSDTSKFLSYITPTNVQEVRLGDWGALKSFYGANQILLGNRSFFNELKIEVTKENGSVYAYTLANNVPWVDCTSAAVKDCSNNTVEFPAYPANLAASTGTILDTITLESGFVYIIGTANPVSLVVGDTYKISAYSTTSPTSGDTVSQDYNFKVVCDNFSDLQVLWENELGGNEYYNFSNKEIITINNKTKTYKKDRNDWTTFETTFDFPFYYEQVEEKRDTVYQSTYRENYKLTSRLLNDEEVLRLKSLFYSKNIQIRIDDIWRPALPAKSSMKLINSDIPGFKYYQFEITVDLNKNLI